MAYGLAVVSLLLPALALADCTDCHKTYTAGKILESKDKVAVCKGKLQDAIGEIEYLKTRLDTLNRIAGPLKEKEVGYQWIEKKMARAQDSYDSLLKIDVTCLEQLVGEKSVVGEKLRVAYLAVNDARDELKRRHTFGAIVLSSLLVLIFGFAAYLKVSPAPSDREETPGWEFDPRRDDEPYKKMAARVSWPEVKPRAEE